MLIQMYEYLCNPYGPHGVPRPSVLASSYYSLGRGLKSRGRICSTEEVILT